ncbi:MAG TPA: class I SAM-dependent methyltransferase [Acidimicrobiales bacterium]|nr:class I SAM-dependent methyltransferase [Acidimicrobiales bacterium]
MRERACCPDAWLCPVCGAAGDRARSRFALAGDRAADGLDATAFRPSSGHFGQTAGTLMRCTACGHGSLAEAPDASAVSQAYQEAADPVSLREETGQVATATRALQSIEHFVSPGRMVDVGCWTGSFLVAARQRGWDATGIDPSSWAVARAQERGLDVRQGDLGSDRLDGGAYRLVVLCDVLEHLEDPGRALDAVREMVEPAGALYLTVPDAGSLVARVLGRRWWSVLPMHLQYFTRASLALLLADHGFTVGTVMTDPKAFSVRYYAERLGGYSPRLERLGAAFVDRLRIGERLVAPDFRDRMAVLARPAGAPRARETGGGDHPPGQPVR